MSPAIHDRQSALGKCNAASGLPLEDQEPGSGGASRTNARHECPNLAYSPDVTGAKWRFEPSP